MMSRGFVLIDGNPMEPDDCDVIAQFEHLDVGEPVPDGWRVLSGNMHFSAMVRVVMRYEIEEDTT